MKFALFYEIPVARPWDAESEHRAYKDTLEQAILGDRVGFHAFWTVEHHFLEEYSHCSNPEVLYGAIAARTERIRLGYGVRLTPKPYNHPVRSAESAAVLDLLSDGRVDFGTGRSATRLEMEGFGIDPAETRAMWQEAIGHIVGCWSNDEYQFDGEHWSMPKRRVLPKPIQKPHPPVWGATTSDDGHQLVGSLGLGLCSFAVGVPPEEIKRKIDLYREAIAGCTEPLATYVHDQAATFTMACVAPTEAEALETARESFEWYPKAGARNIAAVARWMEEERQALGNYEYAADMRAVDDDGSLDLLSLEYLTESGACVAGTPDQAVEMCRRYEEAGVDLLLCLVNPYKIGHDEVMQTIELMGQHVIPAFAHRGRRKEQPMPRLHQVPRAEAEAPIVISMYDFLFGDRDPVAEPGTETGSPGDWWTVFANAPDVLEHAVNGFVLYGSPNRKLDPVLRELGQARAGWTAQSQFVFSQHCKSMRGLGVSEDRIAAVPHWQVADCFSDVERLVLAYTDYLVYDHGRVPDEVFEALRDHLSDEEVLELTYMTALYLQHAVMSRALRTEFDDVPDRIVEVAAPDGSVAAGLRITVDDA